MANEFEKTYEVLKTAIRMEIDGKEFYQKASAASGNDLGKKLLAKLAQEEDIHRKVFEDIFETIRKTKGWPKEKIVIDTGKSVQNVFVTAIKEMNKNVKPTSSEMDDVQTAMAMENKTYDYYVINGRLATLPAEKEFYNALAGQEEEHHRSLMDYLEFLNNPSAYFVRTERQSVDGG
jgi:rubrerythrin